MVNVIGYGNSLKIHFPTTPLLELTAYQNMQRNTILTPSRTSPGVKPDMMLTKIGFAPALGAGKYNLMEIYNDFN